MKEWRKERRESERIRNRDREGRRENKSFLMRQGLEINNTTISRENA